MNIKEFAALKPGDKIENPASHSAGQVVEINDDGVYVAWGGNTARPFFYPAQETAWFSWVKLESDNGSTET